VLILASHRELRKSGLPGTISMTVADLYRF
jgi:hypothetical protein